jgi:recombination endonuclease VII
MKSCTRCGRALPITAFRRDSRYKDGVMSWCKSCRRAYDRVKQREYYRANPEKRRQKRRREQLWRRYGIKWRQKALVFEASDGLCALCYDAPATQIDHDHVTGRIRGALCADCNRGLGCFGDDPERLRLAVEYLTEAHELILVEGG